MVCLIPNHANGLLIGKPVALRLLYFVSKMTFGGRSISIVRFCSGLRYCGSKYHFDMFGAAYWLFSYLQRVVVLTFRYRQRVNIADINMLSITKN